MQAVTSPRRHAVVGSGQLLKVVGGAVTSKSQQMQTVTNGCRQLQTVACSCVQLHAVTNGCRQLQTVTNGCRQLQTVTNGCRQLQTVACSCVQLHAVTSIQWHAVATSSILGALSRIWHCSCQSREWCEARTGAARTDGPQRER
jgi:hypothetical protein